MDTIALLPIELAAFLFVSTTAATRTTTTTTYLVVCRFNRLLKLDRLFECRMKVETGASRPFLVRIAYLIVLIAIIIHWNGCFYYLISKQVGLNVDKWVFNEMSENNTLAYEYLTCYFWSTLMLTTIGEVNMPETTFECVVMSVNFLVAIVLIATLVGNIGSVIAKMNMQQDKFQHRVDAIKSLMKARRVSDELDRRVIKWFDYLYKNKRTVDEADVFAKLPDRLAVELAAQVNLHTLKSVNIFTDCEDGLLRELATKLRLQVYSPGDFVCKKGDIGKEMYIVQKGSLNVVSDDERVCFVTLGVGSYFGEISILNIAGSLTGHRRTANVKSVGYTELLRLSKSDLWRSLADYPLNKRMIIEKGKAKLRKDKLLDEHFERNKVNVYELMDAMVEKNMDEFVDASVELKLRKLEAKSDKVEARLSATLAQMDECCEAIRARMGQLLALETLKFGQSL